MSLQEETQTPVDADFMFDADELAHLERVTHLRGILGLDGGNGFIATWADADKGATSLVTRGLVAPPAEQGDEPRPDEVSEPLRTFLAVLFAGPARLGLSVANGPTTAAIVLSFVGDRTFAALPEPGASPANTRIGLVDSDQLDEIAASSVGASDSASTLESVGAVQPSFVLDLDEFLRLSQRITVGSESATELVTSDLQRWGLPAEMAADLVSYIVHGGRAVTAQLVTTQSGRLATDVDVWFGRDEAWWHADEGESTVTLRRVSRADAELGIREMANRALEAGR